MPTHRLAGGLALAVLITGCRNKQGDVPEAACGADHAAGWQGWSALPEALEAPAVAKRGGRLWVMGGYDFETGARDEVVSVDLSEGFEGSGEWREETPLPAPTEHQGAVVTSAGTIVLVGGDLDYGSEVRDSVWVAQLEADGTLGAWEEAPPLPEGRTLHALAIRRGDVGDDLYVVGGTWDFADGMVFSDTVWHTRTNLSGVPGEWEEVMPLPEARGWAAAAVQEGQLVVSGGLSAWGPARSEATVWTASIGEQGALGAWTEGPALPMARHRHSMTEVDQVLHVAGGDSDGGELDEVLVANLGQDWALGQPLPEQRFSHGAVEGDGELIVVGGFFEFRETRDTVWSIAGCGG